MFALTPPTVDTIAFVSTTMGNTEVMAMNPDGSDLRDLSHRTDPSNSYPAWSPDGSLIAFTSGRDGDDEIYVMNLDGSGLVRLTTSTGLDVLDSWRR